MAFGAPETQAREGCSLGRAESARGGGRDLGRPQAPDLGPFPSFRPVAAAGPRASFSAAGRDVPRHVSACPHPRCLPTDPCPPHDADRPEGAPGDPRRRLAGCLRATRWRLVPARVASAGPCPVAEPDLGAQRPDTGVPFEATPARASAPGGGDCCGAPWVTRWRLQAWTRGVENVGVQAVHDSAGSLPVFFKL